MTEKPSAALVLVVIHRAEGPRGSSITLGFESDKNVHAPETLVLHVNKRDDKGIEHPREFWWDRFPIGRRFQLTVQAEEDKKNG